MDGAPENAEEGDARDPTTASQTQLLHINPPEVKGGGNTTLYVSERSDRTLN